MRISYSPLSWLFLLLQLVLLLTSHLLDAQSLPPMPTAPPAALRPNRINCNNAQLTWTKGDGTHTLLVVKDNTYTSLAVMHPAQQIDSAGFGLYPSYTANQVFGQGSETRPGAYVVYADTGRVANITHLQPNRLYTVRAYTYNINKAYDSLGTVVTQYPGVPAGNYYLLDSAQYVLHTLPACPNVQPLAGPSGIQVQVLDCSTARITLRPGNGEGRIIVVADNAYYTETQPVDGETYFPSPIYGLGSKTNPRKTDFVVSAGRDTSVTVYGLVPGRVYDISAYEYNSLPGPDGGPSDVFDYEHTHASTAHAYMVVSQCPVPEPTVPASNLVTRQLTCNSVRLSWSPGSGTGRLVVMRSAGAGIMMPTQSASYLGNPIFGQGSQTQPGCYVLQVANDTAVTVQGLSGLTYYEVSVYEYRLDGQNRPVYLLSKRPANTFFITPFCAPVGPPTVAARQLEVRSAAAADFGNATVNLRWTTGNGARWLALIRDARSGRASLETPVDYTTYTPVSNQLVPANLLAAGTYFVGGGVYAGVAADSVLTLSQLPIGHEYEVAIYEYNVDTLYGPLYSPVPAVLTFRTPRKAPVLAGSLNAAREASLQWTVAGEWQCLGYVVERSTDGVTFSGPSTGPLITQIVQAGSDSARTASYSRVDQPAITAPTHFRLRMVHRDGEAVYSNAVLLTPSVPLPVELVAFTGKLRPAGGVQLNWSTAQEKNSAYFDVERSADGRQFTAIGRVAAAGTSTQLRTYELLDPAPLQQLAYYRLHQVDLDGADTYSAVLSLRPAVLPQQLTVWPNPASPGRQASLRLTGLTDLASPVLVTVRSITGQLVRQQQLPAASVVEWSWSLEGYTPGVYLVEVQTSTGPHVARLLIE